MSAFWRITQKEDVFLINTVGILQPRYLSRTLPWVKQNNWQLNDQSEMYHLIFEQTGFLTHVKNNY